MEKLNNYSYCLPFLEYFWYSLLLLSVKDYKKRKNGTPPQYLTKTIGRLNSNYYYSHYFEMEIFFAHNIR